MRLVLIASASLLIACSNAAPPASPAAPASTCPGTVEAVDGLREVDDGALLKRALGAPGNGYLCTGKVFEVEKPLTVYRVWNKSKPDTRLGRSWSFSTPRGPAEAYRSAYCICAEWSPLDVMVECKVKVGAHIVVGPGQSATCEKTSYPASAINQIFIPNDTSDSANPKLFVDGCSAGAAWP